MSIFDDYKDAKKFLDTDEYKMIEKYIDKICPKEKYKKYEEELAKFSNGEFGEYIEKMEELKEKYGIILMSDVIYNPTEWEKYEKWFNEEYKHRKVEIFSIWKSDFDDIRCSAVIYQNNKPIGNIIASYEKNTLNDMAKCNENSIEKAFKTLIYKEFERYIKLPRISKVSKLLQEIYDNVCTSDSSMCHITDDDWRELYSDRYDDNDIEQLKEEIKKYGLNDVVTFNDGEYKIVGYGNLETSFNDERKISRIKEYER